MLAGNVAYESMGLKTFGFVVRPRGHLAPEKDIDWGAETEWLGAARRRGRGPASALENPLAAVMMGLIYVNPEGVGGQPDPLKHRADMRVTFARMAMDDEETVALTAGGHTVGKAHGNGSAEEPGPGARRRELEDQGLGWMNKVSRGIGGDTVTSGLEGAWTTHPHALGQRLLRDAAGSRLGTAKSPAGAWQWEPVASAKRTCPVDAENPAIRRNPIMTDADMALKVDPAYREISSASAAIRRLPRCSPAPGSSSRTATGARRRATSAPGARRRPDLAGPGPPGPAPVRHRRRRSAIAASGLTVADWSPRPGTARAPSAARKRGGANGARIRLAPQNGWAGNEPARLARVLAVLAADRRHRPAPAWPTPSCWPATWASSRRPRGRRALQPPFTPGRGDARADQTDADSFAVLEPLHDGFRNWLKDPAADSPSGCCSTAAS